MREKCVSLRKPGESLLFFLNELVLLKRKVSVLYHPYTGASPILHYVIPPPPLSVRQRSYDLETWHVALGTQALQSLYK